MENIYSEWLILSCFQSSIKLATTRQEGMLQILSAIRSFRYQVTLLRSLVILVLTTMKQDVVKSCTSYIVLYSIILGPYWHFSCVSVTQPTSAIHFSWITACEWRYSYWGTRLAMFARHIRTRLTITYKEQAEMEVGWLVSVCFTQSANQ